MFKMPSKKAENRLNAFKNLGKGDNDEMRRRRTEVSVELRKNKKDDMLSKRRNWGPEDRPLSDLERAVSLEEMKEGILSPDPRNQLTATAAVRRREYSVTKLKEKSAFKKK